AARPAGDNDPRRAPFRPATVHVQARRHVRVSQPARPARRRDERLDRQEGLRPDRPGTRRRHALAAGRRGPPHRQLRRRPQEEFAPGRVGIRAGRREPPRAGWPPESARGAPPRGRVPAGASAGSGLIGTYAPLLLEDRPMTTNGNHPALAPEAPAVVATPS